MKCNHCGSEQKDGSTFCSECGNKLDAPKKCFCCNCGKKLQSDAKFCPQCGTSTTNTNASCDVATNQSDPGDQWSSGTAGEYHTSNSVPPYSNSSKAQTTFQKWKNTLQEKWNALDSFLKIVTVALGVAILLLIIAVLSHRVIASIISIMQIVGLILVWQMHKGKVKGTDDRTKKIVLGIMLERLRTLKSLKLRTPPNGRFLSRKSLWKSSSST